MSRIIIFIPIDNTVNISKISSGVSHAIKNKNDKFSVYKFRLRDCIVKEDFCISKESMYTSCFSRLIYENSEHFLKVVTSKVYKIKNNADIILINGLEYNTHCCSILEFNYKIACILNAEIILVISINGDTFRNFEKKMKLIRFNKRVSGIIFNKIDFLFKENGNFSLSENSIYRKIDNKYIQKTVDKLSKKSVSIFGIIPWNLKILNIELINIIEYLNANVLNKGMYTVNKLQSITLFLDKNIEIIREIQSNTLLVIPFYHFKKSFKYIKRNNIVNVLLTDFLESESDIKKFIILNKLNNLFIIYVEESIYNVMHNLKKLEFDKVIFTFQRKNNIKNYISYYIDQNWIQSISFSKDINIKNRNHIFSSSYFFYNRVTELAQYADKRIILPEGDEPRTILAASICTKNKIARCVLLGKLDKIYKVAKSNKIKLEQDIEIIDPEKIRSNYANRLVKLRKNITMDSALKILKKDDIILGILMLEKNEVDGLVSGAIHTTAKVIRPSLQIIKMFPGNLLVSSIFFMLLPKKILIYGDCAVNLNPNSEQLAEIAIQSADSASYFGIDPHIAMISYSTGCSGSGKDVDKVKEATDIVRKRRPDLSIDGPLQYDAATVKEVALIKAPNSPVAGKATVLIFPDLNTGNAVYKAVQRTANINAIGPILQGMRKPVNDLSRGALVNDIVYTIALTAIQSKQIEEKLSILYKK